MAYQFSALVIQGNFAENAQGVFAELGFPNGVHAGVASFVEATNPTPGTRYLAVNDGWTMITDASHFVNVRATAPFGSMWSPPVEKFMLDATSDGRGFGFIMSSVSDTHGFSLFENGEMTRAMLNTMEGMVVVDEGDPLKEEAPVLQMDDKQSAILLLMEMLEIPFRAFETADFQAVAFETQRVG